MYIYLFLYYLLTLLLLLYKEVALKNAFPVSLDRMMFCVYLQIVSCHFSLYTNSKISEKKCRDLCSIFVIFKRKCKIIYFKLLNIT